MMVWPPLGASIGHGELARPGRASIADQRSVSLKGDLSRPDRAVAVESHRRQVRLGPRSCRMPAGEAGPG